MNYLDQFRKFISSHNLYTGLRLTLAALLPCLIFQKMGILGEVMAFPLGTLLIGSSDNVGPFHRRRNSIIIGIISCFIVACLTGLLRHIPFIIFFEIVLFGIFFSLIGVYGNRANSIGTISLLVFVFNMDEHLDGGKTIQNALIFAAGGLWYLLLFLVLNKLRPYKLIQQMLGEDFIELGKLLRIKSNYYFPKPDYDELFKDLLHQQVVLRENQESLREILFRTREIVKESTQTSRILMLMFLDSIDMFEQILNSQQDYRELNRVFGENKILRLFGTYIRWLSEELQVIGLAVQSGTESKPRRDLDESYHKCEAAFVRMREQDLTHENIENFIMLRQILNSLRDITERVKKLHRATRYDLDLSQHSLTKELNLENFTPREEFHPRILLDNLSLKSSHFRHSLRLTLALMIGYLVSLAYDVGHGYWILLTVVTIMKPAFSITKQRNYYRIAGTLLGVIAGFMILYSTRDQTVHFVLMMLAMIAAYTFLKVNYFVASLGITIYVILSFHFLNPQSIGEVLTDRVLDTLAGSVISYLVASFVLPVWEHTQINQYLEDALQANRKYFSVVATSFVDAPLQIGELKHTRKEAVIALANLSDNFQRMLSEPKKRQVKSTEYHQFVATSHMVTSYIASLSTYAQNGADKYRSPEFRPIANQINRQFDLAAKIIDGDIRNFEGLPKPLPLPPHERLRELMRQRKKEIREKGNRPSENLTNQRMMSDLQAINGLFDLIYAILLDEVKIAQQIVSSR